VPFANPQLAKPALLAASNRKKALRDRADGRVIFLDSVAGVEGIAQSVPHQVNA
jgi:hypothetical protein